MEVLHLAFILQTLRLAPDLSTQIKAVSSSKAAHEFSVLPMCEVSHDKLQLHQDVRLNDLLGDLSSLNTLAKQARADYIIHTGDFGFYDERSLGSIADK